MRSLHMEMYHNGYKFKSKHRTRKRKTYARIGCVRNQIKERRFHTSMYRFDVVGEIGFLREYLLLGKQTTCVLEMCSIWSWEFSKMRDSGIRFETLFCAKWRISRNMHSISVSNYYWLYSISNYVSGVMLPWLQVIGILVWL